MERINFGYSVKNIPLTNERNYKAKLIERIEMVIKRMRWKAIFFNEKKEELPNESETYGLKTSNCPKQVKELIPFETDLIQLAKDIKFRKQYKQNNQYISKTHEGRYKEYTQFR